MNTGDLNIVLPELILAVFAMAALMFAVYTRKDETAPLITWATAGLMIALGLWIAFAPMANRTAFNGAFIDDGFSRFAKVVMLWASAIMLVLSQDYLRRNDMFKFEYPILIALATLGMMMMVSAGLLIRTTLARSTMTFRTLPGSATSAARETDAEMPRAIAANADRVKILREISNTGNA